MKSSCTAMMYIIYVVKITKPSIIVDEKLIINIMPNTYVI